MTSLDYGTKRRYIIGQPSMYGFANSFFKHSYLSHGTALVLHDLRAATGTVFVNREQTAKKTTTRLSQKGIDQAFRNQPRRSAFEFEIEGQTITFLNGKHTGNAGVIELVRPNGEVSRTTSLERTLIDCVVRPQYAGGVIEVARAFRKASAQVSVQGIAELLKKTKYAYPYHQAIGFLLQRSGLSQDHLQPLRAVPARFNFYLDYGMKKPNFNTDWKIYYPAELP